MPRPAQGITSFNRALGSRILTERLTTPLDIMPRGGSYHALSQNDVPDTIPKQPVLRAGCLVCNFLVQQLKQIFVSQRNNQPAIVGICIPATTDQ